MAIIHDGNSVPISTTNPLPSSLFGSEIQVPVDIQSRYATTIQTHAGTMIAPSGYVYGSFVDCNGFSEIAFTLVNDALTASRLLVQWSNDGVNLHGEETPIPTSSATRNQGVVPIKARYSKAVIYNGDAVPHTMSAWAYLKA